MSFFVVADVVHVGDQDVVALRGQVPPKKTYTQHIYVEDGAVTKIQIESHSERSGR